MILILCQNQSRNQEEKKQKSIAKPKANYQKENYTFEKMFSAMWL